MKEQKNVFFNLKSSFLLNVNLEITKSLIDFHLSFIKIYDKKLFFFLNIFESF